MRLTTSRYYTPSGRSIQAKGIEPDVVVDQPIVSPLGVVIHPRSEADLRGHLENDQEPTTPATALPDDAKPEQVQPGAAKPGDAKPGATAPGAQPAAPVGNPPVPGSDEDYQLQRALELLRGVALFNRQRDNALALNG
ncbi:MAG TPA: peptidase S41, partial [Tistrella mobilis]|nr:peptidase S41 [Tistrella mobilis]